MRVLRRSPLYSPSHSLVASSDARAGLPVARGRPAALRSQPGPSRRIVCQTASSGMAGLASKIAKTGSDLPVVC
jgi:hypothetical protein